MLKKVFLRDGRDRDLVVGFLWQIVNDTTLAVGRQLFEDVDWLFNVERIAIDSSRWKK